MVENFDTFSYLQRIIDGAFTGCLISESVPIWLKSPKHVTNHSPEIGDLRQSEKLSEIKPPFGAQTSNKMAPQWHPP